MTALAGCASSPSAPLAAPSQASVAGKRDLWQSLVKGATADQVRAALGNPVEVRPMQQVPGHGEIWIYRRTKVATDMVVTRMENISSIDPFTGQQKTIANPVYSQVTRTIEEELQLLMFDGGLVNWKRGVRGNQDYH
jgi:hypothetical protein